MIAASLLMGVVMMLVMSRPASARLTMLMPASGAQTSKKNTSLRGVLLLVALAGLGWLWGSTVAVIIITFIMISLTAWWLWRLRNQARLGCRNREQIAAGCAALSAEVAAGRVPIAALISVASDFPILEFSAAIAATGGDPVPAWRGEAIEPGKHGLITLAQAWQVSVQTGAPMAPALNSVAERLRENKNLAATVAGELAAPRATGRLLAVLPLVGLALSYGLGANPLHFFLNELVGQVCLLLGVLLACIGLWWTEKLSHKTIRW